MTNKFNTHDIVTDGTYEGRIYKVLDLAGVTPSYDVVLPGGHAVRSEIELTMVRKYTEPSKSFAQECAEYLAA